MRPATPRIAPRTDLEGELRALAGAMPGGQVSNLGATLAWHPELLRVFGTIGRWMLEGERVPLRQRVIVALRVGWRTRALYEFAQNQRRGARASPARRRCWCSWSTSSARAMRSPTRPGSAPPGTGTHRPCSSSSC
jgi:hypothetical protein